MMSFFNRSSKANVRVRVRYFFLGGVVGAAYPFSSASFPSKKDEYPWFARSNAHTLCLGDSASMSFISDEKENAPEQPICKVNIMNIMIGNN